MVKRKNELKTTVNEQMRGGSGSVLIEHILDGEGLYGKGRLYANVVLKPGCSVGFHVHEGEMESYFITKGAAEYDDNGTKVRLAVGDSTYTPDGEGHGITNIGEGDLEFVALIIYS